MTIDWISTGLWSNSQLEKMIQNKQNCQLVCLFSHKILHLVLMEPSGYHLQRNSKLLYNFPYILCFQYQFPLQLVWEIPLSQVHKRLYSGTDCVLNLFELQKQKGCHSSSICVALSTTAQVCFHKMKVTFHPTTTINSKIDCWK